MDFVSMAFLSALFCFLFLGGFIGWLFFFILGKIFWNGGSGIGFSFKNVIASLQPDLGESMEQKMLAVDGFLRPKLAAWLRHEGTLNAIEPILAVEVEKFVDTKLLKRWPMLAVFLNADALANLKSGLTEEIKKALPDALNAAGNGLLDKMQQEHLIVQKVNDFLVQDSRGILKNYLKPVFSKLALAGALSGIIIAFICFFLQFLFL